ncbi:MAG: carbonic anhydrase, partial [Oceanobacter sp.]
MKKLVQGVLNFQKNVYPENKDLFGELADGQSPDVLFITCSDSRIDPNLVTGSEPGDLFICRNAGNIVPPHNTNTGGMTASIEYAVAVLG